MLIGRAKSNKRMDEIMNLKIRAIIFDISSCFEEILPLSAQLWASKDPRRFESNHLKSSNTDRIIFVDSPRAFCTEGTGGSSSMFGSMNRIRNKNLHFPMQLGIQKLHHPEEPLSAIIDG